MAGSTCKPHVPLAGAVRGPLQGSLVVKQSVPTVVKTREDGTPVERIKPVETVLYRDIIQQEFWDDFGHVLAPM